MFEVKTDIKLLPCPFCGGKPRIKGKKLIRVSCGCSAKTYGRSVKEATTAWNRRKYVEPT